ncbi:MAG: polysaccharide biosynthesis C-terminal domain-containing protein, partial [bacterium]
RRMDDLKAFYEKGIYYSNVFLLTMVAGLILLSGFLFDVVLQKYHEGAAVLRYFALTGLFVSWQVFGESVLYGMGKPNKPFYFRIFTSAINLLMNIFLIKYFGFWGAITASLVSLAVLAGLATYIVRAEIEFTFIGILKRGWDLVHFVRNLKR